MDGKWRRLDEKTVYETEYLKVDLADVVLPDDTQIEHHTMRVHTGRATGVLAHDPEKGVLLIWRHRFVTDSWGWELPAGAAGDNERLEQAAEREMLEETGWKPNKLTKLFTVFPMPGVVENEDTCFLSEGATWVGPGRDTNEAADLAWMPLDQVKEAIKKNEVTDAFSVTSLLYAFQFGPLSGPQTA